MSTYSSSCDVKVGIDHLVSIVGDFNTRMCRIAMPIYSGGDYDVIANPDICVRNGTTTELECHSRSKNKYAPKKIIYNGKATIVFWIDGTKTIVKKAKGEPYNRYNAFCAALAKKVFGNNSVVNRFVNSGIEQK